MPMTGEWKNQALNAGFKGEKPTEYAKFVGAASASAATAVEASAIGSVIKKTQSLANGNVLIFTVLSGGAGLVALRPYYVVGKAAGQFEVALTEGGAAISFTSELKVASEYVILTEMSGGGYKRIATAFGAAAAGKTEDTTEHILKIPAGKEIKYEMYFFEEAGGKVMGTSILTTPELFGAEGTYTVKSTTADLNLAEGSPAP